MRLRRFFCMALALLLVIGSSSTPVSAIKVEPITPPNYNQEFCFTSCNGIIQYKYSG